MVSNKNYLVKQQSKFFSNVVLLSALILGCFDRSTTGMLTLSPMMVAPVCDVGDPLNLTCTAPVEFLKWSIVVVNEQGRDDEITAFSNSRDLSQLLTERTVNSTTFTFIRTSAQNQSLTSTLSIDSVGIGLNGTVVRCVNAVNPMTSASTTIQINDVNSTLEQYSLLLHVTSEEYEVGNVTVSVEWTQLLGAVYNVRVSPLVPIMFTGGTSLQLTILYNTHYNLSVEATDPCRPGDPGAHSTAFVGLNYAVCGHPELLPLANNDSVTRVFGDNHLPVEGSIITFSCPPGMELIGSNSATCTENGQWELSDVSGLVCMAKSKAQVTCDHPLNEASMTDSDSIIVVDYFGPAVEGTTVTLQCRCPQYVLIGPNTTTCMGNGEWEPNPRKVGCKETSKSRSSDDLMVAVSATVLAFLVISISTFIIGFLCGHYFRGRKYKLSSNALLSAPPRQPLPLHEDVNVLTSGVEHQEQALELKENVAYGPSKSTNMPR